VPAAHPRWMSRSGSRLPRSSRHGQQERTANAITAGGARQGLESRCISATCVATANASRLKPPMNRMQRRHRQSGHGPDAASRWASARRRARRAAGGHPAAPERARRALPARRPSRPHARGAARPSRRVENQAREMRLLPAA
jgi:hypothetical protein